MINWCVCLYSAMSPSTIKSGQPIGGAYDTIELVAPTGGACEDVNHKNTKGKAEKANVPKPKESRYICRSVLIDNLFLRKEF